MFSTVVLLFIVHILGTFNFLMHSYKTQNQCKAKEIILNVGDFFSFTWKTESKYCESWLWTDRKVNYFSGTNATTLYKVLESIPTQRFCTAYHHSAASETLLVSLRFGLQISTQKKQYNLKSGYNQKVALFCAWRVKAGCSFHFPRRKLL